MKKTNSACGIFSIIFGIIGICCLGSWLAFFPLAIAVTLALFGIADETKYKWSSAVGIIFASIGILVCAVYMLFFIKDPKTIFSNKSRLKAYKNYVDEYYENDSYSDDGYYDEVNYDEYSDDGSYDYEQFYNDEAPEDEFYTDPEGFYTDSDEYYTDSEDYYTDPNATFAEPDAFYTDSGDEYF